MLDTLRTSIQSENPYVSLFELSDDENQLTEKNTKPSLESQVSKYTGYKIKQMSIYFSKTRRNYIS